MWESKGNRNKETGKSKQARTDKKQHTIMPTAMMATASSNNNNNKHQLQQKMEGRDLTT